MKKITNDRCKIIALLGFMCVLVPFVFYTLWFYAIEFGETREEIVAIFESFFPDFLSPSRRISFVGLIFAILATLLGYSCLNRLTNLWRVFSVLAFVLGAVFVFLIVFSLM